MTVLLDRVPVPLYQDVFIIGPDETIFDNEIVFLGSFEEAVIHLNSLEPEVDTIPMVIHAVITPGTVIPTMVADQRRKFIMKYDETLGTGSIVEVDGQTDQDIAVEVEQISDSETFFSTEDLEGMYLIYGYQIDVVFSIDRKNVKDEEIDCCIRIGNVAEQLAMELGE